MKKLLLIWIIGVALVLTLVGCQARGRIRAAHASGDSADSNRSVSAQETAPSPEGIGPL